MEERDESLGGKRWKKKKIAERDRERVTGMCRGKSEIAWIFNRDGWCLFYFDFLFIFLSIRFLKIFS